VLRFYLVLSMLLAADGRLAAVLKIAGAEHRLADGEYLLWDDTFPHEATNDSDEVRTVLLCGGAACRSTCGFSRTC
jgi:aspartate beta-hydroxylase